MTPFKFWRNVRELAQSDYSADPPHESLRKAYAIFRAEQTPSRLFRLRPAAAGMIRRGAEPARSVYELDAGRFVTLEPTPCEDGWRLSGFAAGIRDTNVLLFCGETLSETAMADGEFEFDGLAPGCYSMAFVREGDESRWICDLELGENPERT